MADRRYAYVCQDPAEARRVNTLALVPEHVTYDWISIELLRAGVRWRYCVSCGHEIPLQGEHVQICTRLHEAWSRDYQCSRCYSIAATVNRVGEYDHLTRGIGDSDTWSRFLPSTVADTLAGLHLSPFKPITVLDTHARPYRFEDLILYPDRR